MEQGRPFRLADLGDHARAALATLQQAADARDKDWPKFTGQATEFHLRNARAWASAAAGEDLAAQVDPGFVMGPDAFLAAAP
jgi:CO dehydrogenase maturation factor